MFDLKRLIGVKSYSFRAITDNRSCAEAILSCGSTVVDLSGVHVDYDRPETWHDVIKSYTDNGIVIAGIGVVGARPDSAWNRRFFEFARMAGSELISVTFQPQEWEKTTTSLEQLSSEYDILTAIHNHGGYNWLGNSTILDYVFSRTSYRIGLCLDTAWCIQTEMENPAEWMDKFGSRTYGIHFKDFVWSRDGKHADTVVGDGALKLADVLEKFKSLDTIRSAAVEYEGDNAVEATRLSIQNILSLY